MLTALLFTLTCAKTPTEAKAILSRANACYACNLNLELWEGYPRVVVTSSQTIYTNGNYVDALYNPGLSVEVILPPDQTLLETASGSLTLNLKPNSVCQLDLP